MTQAIDDEILMKMAYSRHTFKNRVEEKIGGALFEFYKAECAEANGQTRWVEHWRSEAGRPLGELQVVLLHEIRGFKDRRRAFTELKEYIRSKDASNRHVAEAAVKRDFKLKKLKAGVPADSWRTLETMVENTAGEVMD